MRSLLEGLPPEVAKRIHPDWQKNEAEYWAQHDTLFSTAVFVRVSRFCAPQIKDSSNKRREKTLYSLRSSANRYKYADRWIGFANGRVIASGTSPVEVFHAA
jgi:hypothetical protein